MAISGDGNVIVAGAMYLEDNAGGVYVFVRGDGTWAGWSEAKLLTAETPASGDYLGVSVAISYNGRVIAAGAYEYNSANGAVYVFVKGDNEWLERPNNFETVILTEIVPATEAGAYLGCSVAISSDGSVIAAGASDFMDTQNGLDDQGAVYVANSGNIWPK